MAVTRKTQKDVGNFESKLIGPFTTRQTIFIGIGGVIDVVIGLTMESAGVDFATIAAVCIVIIAPFVWLGYAHPYGMKAEEFLLEYYIYHMAAPKIRKYKTETGLDLMKWEPPTEPETDPKKKKNNTRNTAPKHKKDPDFPDYL
jgi:hypothetical protein